MRMSTIDPVSHIHLHSRLCRFHLQRPAGHRISQSISHSRFFHLPSSDLQSLSIQAEAVIQTRFAASINGERLFTLRRSAEIERSAFNKGSFACGNHIDHRKIGIRVHLEQKRVDFGLEVARHVPIRVVCHVDHRSACCTSLVFQF